MKITLIHGQNHKGSTYHAARMTAEKIGGDITEFFLPRDFSGGCMGCFACLHRGREYCPRAEEVAKIFDPMLAADVIILSSPTYVMEMTAHLKGFLEHIFTAWFAHRPEEAMFSKTAVVVSTAAGLGMTEVTKSMAKQMFYLGIPKVYRLSFKVAASDWDEVSEKIIAKIETKTSHTARKIVKTVLADGHATPGVLTKMFFYIMRMGQMANDYLSLDKDYWEDKGWLGKARPWKRG